MSETIPNPELELEPTWEVATLFPNQGQWSEEEYLALNTNRLVEYSDGCLEFLPMPTLSHQLIMLFLYEALKAHVSAQDLGSVRRRWVQGAGSPWQIPRAGRDLHKQRERAANG